MDGSQVHALLLMLRIRTNSFSIPELAYIVHWPLEELVLWLGLVIVCGFFVPDINYTLTSSEGYVHNKPFFHYP